MFARAVRRQRREQLVCIARRSGLSGVRGHRASVGDPRQSGPQSPPLGDAVAGRRREAR